MSHILTIEVSESAYEALVREAKSHGKTPAAVASTTLERQFSNGAGEHPGRPESSNRQGFTSVFGIVSLPDPVGLDNEQIDADLAREYGDTHENR